MSRGKEEMKVHYEVQYKLVGWNKWGHWSSSDHLEYAQSSAEVALGVDYGRKLKAIRVIKVETHEEIIKETIL